MSPSQSRTIIFITGAFVSHSCWEEWILFFQSKGYKTVAPPWLYKNETACGLRNLESESKVSFIRLKNLLDYYTKIIEQLPEKPILIGHSYGGLLTQLLVEKELATAAIFIHSFPPQGIMSLKLSFYKAVWASFGFFTSAKKPYLISFQKWQHDFTNGMSIEEQQDTYEKFAVPESKLAIRDILTSQVKIDFRKKHVPILFISGTEDKITPASLNYSNFQRYKNIESIKLYKEFKGHNHFIPVHKNWKKTADFIKDWLQVHKSNFNFLIIGFKIIGFLF